MAGDFSKRLLELFRRESVDEDLTVALSVDSRGENFSKHMPTMTLYYSQAKL